MTKAKDVTAVHDFNLEIEDREFIVFVGPSGCGKSTTLRMIAGLEEISAGDVSIDNRRVNDVPPKDRDIAMVFQNYALYPHMTVYDNMAFGLKLRKYPKPEIKKRVSEAAAILGLEEMLDRKPKALSGGQRQRVAVGRAIVRQPKVFLFDEPLSNLDAKLRVQMRTEITKLHQRLQATMILRPRMIRSRPWTMGDRIVVMKDGVVQQIDAPLKLYNEPNNQFVAGFLGSPPMNFMSGKLKAEGDAIAFQEIQDGVVECKFTGRPELKPYLGKKRRARHSPRGSGIPRRRQPARRLPFSGAGRSGRADGCGKPIFICRRTRTRSFAAARKRSIIARPMATGCSSK